MRRSWAGRRRYGARPCLYRVWPEFTPVAGRGGLLYPEPGQRLGIELHLFERGLREGLAAGLRDAFLVQPVVAVDVRRRAGLAELDDGLRDLRHADDGAEVVEQADL